MGQNSHSSNQGSTLENQQLSRYTKMQQTLCVSLSVICLSAWCFIYVQAGPMPIHCPDDTYYHKAMCCPAANCEITGNCGGGMSKISSICNSEWGKSRCCQTCADHWVDAECRYGNIKSEHACAKWAKRMGGKEEYCKSDSGKEYCCGWCKYGPKASNKAVTPCGA